MSHSRFSKNYQVYVNALMMIFIALVGTGYSGFIWGAPVAENPVSAATQAKRLIKPDSKIQARFAGIRDAREKQDALIKLAELMNRDLNKFEDVGRQLVLFVSQDPDAPRMMTADVILVSIPAGMQAEIIMGIAPFLNDAILAGVAKGLLDTCESSDLSLFQPALNVQIETGEEPSDAFVAYLVNRAPGRAFSILAKAVSAKEERLTLLESAHMVADYVWRKEEFGEPYAAEKSKRSAIEGLQQLVKSKVFFCRLYVSEMLRANPELRTAELAKALSDDKNEYVKAAVEKWDNK